MGTGFSGSNPSSPDASSSPLLSKPWMRAAVWSFSSSESSSPPPETEAASSSSLASSSLDSSTTGSAFFAFALALAPSAFEEAAFFVAAAETSSFSSFLDFLLLVSLFFFSVSAFFAAGFASGLLSSSSSLLRKSAARLRGLICRFDCSPLALGVESGLASLAAPSFFLSFWVGFEASLGVWLGWDSTFLVFFAGASLAPAAAAVHCQHMHKIKIHNVFKRS